MEKIYTECGHLAKLISSKSPLLPSIIDCSWTPPGKSHYPEYMTRRIPTAQFFCIDKVSDHASPLPHMFPPPGVFAQAMSDLGVSKSRPVVVYDSHGLLAAARVYWTLRLFGHPSVTVLLGGLPRWESEGHALELGAPPSIAPTPLETWDPIASSGVVALEAVRGISKAASLPGSTTLPTSPLMLDARAANRFSGEVPEPRPGLDKGHIPGSLNLPFPNILDTSGKGAQLLPAGPLAAAFKAAGVDISRPGDIILTCGSGVTSCILAVGLLALGRDTKTPIYDGSFAEWGLPGTNTLGTGPPQMK